MLMLINSIISALQKINDSQSIILFFLALIGTLYVLIKVFSFLSVIWKYCLRRELDLLERYGRCWVIILGASEEIGLAFCESFARRGFNICGISSNQKEIDSIMKEINIKYHVETKAIEADFFDPLSYNLHEKTLGQLPENVGILVNCLEKPTTFFNNDLKDSVDCVLVNSYSATYFVKLLIEKLKLRTKKSAIITLGSVMGLTPIPGLSVYSATKAYNRFLSIGLAEEFKGKIDCLILQPGTLKDSKSGDIESTGCFNSLVSASECVESSMTSLGRYSETSGHWKGALKLGLINSLPCLFYQKRVIKKTLN